MKFEHSIFIDKSPKDVYLTYTNVSDWAIWDPETESASLNGEFVIGSTGKIKPKGAPESKIELIEVTLVLGEKRKNENTYEYLFR